jgi:hypothetical protein
MHLILLSDGFVTQARCQGRSSLKLLPVPAGCWVPFHAFFCKDPSKCMLISLSEFFCEIIIVYHVKKNCLLGELKEINLSKTM